MFVKKGLFKSYIADLQSSSHGESYRAIIGYLVPEFITALLLYSIPLWLDAAFISTLKSTPTYATLGLTNNFLHFIVKIAEAFGVGAIILSGQFNGVGDYVSAGKSLRDAFWVTVFLGGGLSFLIYVGSFWIYQWHGVSAEIADLGMRFLQIRALGVFFMFIYFALVGFLRGIKNTKTPMTIFIVGVMIFIVADYALIFGAWGFPELGLLGSAIASLLQYGVMMTIALCYVLFSSHTKKYKIELLAPLGNGALAKQLVLLSVPVMLDKGTQAFALLWLCKILSGMGTRVTATFCVIKDMERFALLAGIAGAQVITFLVSNDYGRQQWDSIKVNIKRILFITFLMVSGVLLLFAQYPVFFIKIFDGAGDFTTFAATLFPFLSGLALFDLLQLILSGGLRGSGNVETVMWVRMAFFFGFFMPVSSLLASLPIVDHTFKFLLIYGSYHISNALMSIVYIYKFRSQTWKLPSTRNL